MEENGTEKENAALKYREWNEEELRADARSTEQNLYKPNRIGKIYTSLKGRCWGGLYKKCGVRNV